jgi:hypothetical protein
MVVGLVETALVFILLKSLTSKTESATVAQKIEASEATSDKILRKQLS